MNQWRKILTPICAAVLWSRSQSCSGGFDLRKYTAPKGNAGSGQGFSWAATHSANTNAADNMAARAKLIFVMANRSLRRCEEIARKRAKGKLKHAPPYGSFAARATDNATGSWPSATLA